MAELTVVRLLQNPLGQPAPDGARGDLVQASDGQTERVPAAVGVDCADEQTLRWMLAPPPTRPSAGRPRSGRAGSAAGPLGVSGPGDPPAFRHSVSRPSRLRSRTTRRRRGTGEGDALLVGVLRSSAGSPASGGAVSSWASLLMGGTAAPSDGDTISSRPGQRVTVRDQMAELTTRPGVHVASAHGRCAGRLGSHGSDRRPVGGAERSAGGP